VFDGVEPCAGLGVVKVVAHPYGDADTVAEFQRGNGLPDVVFVLLTAQVCLSAGEGGRLDEELRTVRPNDQQVGPVGAPTDLGLERDSGAVYQPPGPLVGPMLMALSGHENIRSLAIYTNVTAEAIAAAPAEHDPPADTTNGEHHRSRTHIHWISAIATGPRGTRGFSAIEGSSPGTQGPDPHRTRARPVGSPQPEVRHSTAVSRSWRADAA
jgi:hypothetical protein